LRPVELGRIPLEELIGSLVAGFGRRHPEVTFTVAIGSLARGYGEAVDLTIFRCVQETLTNAMQHGGASRVDVEIDEGPSESGARGEGGRTLVLVVRDNGTGVAPDASMGIGMTAMRERVRGIEGSSSIDSSPGRGTTISVRVPLRPGEAAPAARQFEGAPI
jgi:two-component system sensor histidine kinase UhpB